MAKLTVEEWNKLSEQDKQGRQEEMPDELTSPPSGVKEDVVIIAGKERPLKNYEAELRRKHEEDLVAKDTEMQERLAEIQRQQSQSQQQAWYEQVQQMAETEIATTGKTIPLNTILQVANSLYQRNIGETLNTREQANKAVRNFKRSVKNEPDFGAIEDDFDNIVEQLRPEQVNPATLEVIFNSARGKRVKDIEKQAYERGKKEAEKDTQIIGSPTGTTGGGTRPSTSLSSEQQADLERMNKDTAMQWTEEEYVKALKKKQERFKVAGAKNTPQTLNDQMIK